MKTATQEQTLEQLRDSLTQERDQAEQDLKEATARVAVATGEKLTEALDLQEEKKSQIESLNGRLARIAEAQVVKDQIAQKQAAEDHLQERRQLIADAELDSAAAIEAGADIDRLIDELGTEHLRLEEIRQSVRAKVLKSIVRERARQEEVPNIAPAGIRPIIQGRLEQVELVVYTGATQMSVQLAVSQITEKLLQIAKRELQADEKEKRQ